MYEFFVVVGTQYFLQRMQNCFSMKFRRDQGGGLRSGIKRDDSNPRELGRGIMDKRTMRREWGCILSV